MQCDMCGSEEQLYQTDIEGSLLKVCKGCSIHGKVLRRVIPPVPKKQEDTLDPVKTPQLSRPELVQVIVEDYPQRIKLAREKLGLSQKDMAMKLAVKESTLHLFESGHLEPSMDIARKLEKVLRIKLVEQESAASEESLGGRRDSNLTIGDMLKVRKRGKQPES